ncbi:hypothetical protein BD626DRAFT_42542 [Schizophyllum amplum]|uniref:Uncharacterized protein n=1 Tax=Schizophyllum amplum TaxID=97359 RepID=A0A550CDV4_9AGAR|nr:hypothetical protein BD626DRAFT_42542 [Auriculariopsis ampla]
MYSQTKLKEGMQELVDFVDANLDELIAMEKRDRRTQVSNLEVFCRMDIGILTSRDSLKYTVLGVERGLTTNMFGWSDWLGAVLDITFVAHLLPELMGCTVPGCPAIDLEYDMKILTSYILAPKRRTKKSVL